MILVFGAFILGGNRVIKEFGIGLAGGILVDALLIRMAIVPSIMMLFGNANWWFPALARPDTAPALRGPRRPQTPAVGGGGGGGGGGEDPELAGSTTH